MSNYHKLYTPQDSAVVFIDFQPQMTFGVASMDRALMINNVVLLAKVAKEFGVPTVLTAVETEGFSGYVWPQLRSEEHTSELQSHSDLVCRLLLEKKKKKNNDFIED